MLLDTNFDIDQLADIIAVSAVLPRFEYSFGSLPLAEGLFRLALSLGPEYHMY
jgi:hypothetical protein